MMSGLARRYMAILRNSSQLQLGCTQKLSSKTDSQEGKCEEIPLDQKEAKIQSIEETAESRKLSTIDEFREDMNPFVKDLFCGKFNTLVLSYPDVLTNDRYYNMENKLHDIRDVLRDRKDLLNQIPIDNQISKDLIMSLRSIGLFGHRGKFQEGGENYSATESLRFLEEVASESLSLSNVITNSSWYGAEVIRRCGNESLKAKYLPRLNSGISISAICVADEYAGFDANSCSSTVLQDLDCLVLNGEKKWVTNAVNADLFLVWAKQVTKYTSEGTNLTPRLTAVLVDAKESSGVTVSESYDTRGLKGCGIASVNFKNVSN